MNMLTHHRKDLMIEARFLPETIEEAEALRHRIHAVVSAGEVDCVAPGQAEAYADQVTGWLVGKRQGVDRKSPNTRSKYRKILQVIEEQTPGGQGGRMGGLGLAGLMASVGSAAAIAPVSMTGAAIALALTPIMYEPVELEELAA